MASTGTAVDQPSADSPWRSIDADARARRRPLLLLVLAAFVVVTALWGPPTGREVVTAWVLLLLLAACGGAWRVWSRSVLRDWAPLIAVLFAYDALRGQADDLGARLVHLPALQNGKPGPGGTDHAHVLPQLRADELLFGWLTGGQAPTVWLQQHLFHSGHVSWYDLLVVPVYLSHFVVPLGIAAALWVWRYGLFRRYVTTLVVLTLATLATYALFPAAPPWMASLNGYLPAGVVRVPAVTLEATHVHTVSSAVQQGQAYANAVAAIPSLHSAVPFMVLLFAWRSVRARVRVLLVLYVLAMTFTLTYGGEHYVVDAFVGWAYAAGAVLAVGWWWRRRAERRPPAPAHVVPAALERTPVPS